MLPVMFIFQPDLYIVPFENCFISLPSSSSWLGFGTSFRMLKISSLVALLLKATAKQRATECPGRESKKRMEGR